MWATVLICLVLCMLIFHYLARFHNFATHLKQEANTSQHLKKTSKRENRTVTLHIHPGVVKLNHNIKYTLMKKQCVATKEKNKATGLYQFSEPVNSALYTYSMILLVSLPKLPTGWSLRILTGWYWLYCLLVVTSYRASMTAILAKPTPK